MEAEAEAILAPYFEALAQGEGVEHRLQGGRARGTQGSAGPQGRVGPPGSQGDIGPSSAREASSNGGATLNREPTVILNLPNVTPGAYKLEAVAGLYGAAGGTGDFPLGAFCELRQAGTVLATVAATFTPVGENPALSSYLPIPLQATANIPSTTDVTLSCNRFGGGATGVTASVSFGNSLIATKVGGVGP